MNIFIQKKNEILVSLLILGPIQFLLSILIAQGIPKNYNSSVHYVSTLGVGQTAWIFNSSVIFLGLCFIVGSYFFKKEYEKKFATFLLFMTGVSAVGVGLFPEDQIPLHGIVTALVFLFSALFLISVFTVDQSNFLKFISLGGLITLLFSLIFLPYLGLDVESTTSFLGMYKGTLERIVIYLNFFCYLVLGGFISKKNKKNSQYNDFISQMNSSRA